MDISFETKALRDICEDQDRALLEFGSAVSSDLQACLADLVAVATVTEIPTGNPGPIDDPAQSYKVELSNGYRVVFCANHVRPPFTESGELDWPSVRRIKILEITHANG